MTDPLGQAIRDILAVRGRDVVLRGESIDPPRKMHLARNVEMSDANGDVMYAENIGMFHADDAPRKGDSLVLIDADGSPIPGESYVLEMVVQDNGYSVKHILRKT